LKYGSVVAIAGTVCLFILQGVNARGDELLSDAKRYFAPLPARIDSPESNPTTKNKTALGKKLFYDPRLSLSGVISCNTCHNLATYGSDNLSSSLGHKFKTGGRNAPTVLNAGLHIAQFWDGRAKDLEEQAKGPVLNPLEMAMPNPDLVIARLKSIPSYGEEFRAAFGGESNPVNYDNVAKAIAAFERTLLTPSRFDNYLKEAVRIMGTTQLGMELRDDEVDKITTFLDSLTGVIPHDALVLPVLPPSTPNTPKPAL